jgi:hypothetical protein
MKAVIRKGNDLIPALNIIPESSKEGAIDPELPISNQLSPDEAASLLRRNDPERVSKRLNTSRLWLESYKHRVKP